MADDYKQPLPTPDPVTKPYWDILKAHALELQRCDGCKQTIFYPRPICPSCMSDALTWTKVSGRGVVHAFAIPHRHPSPPSPRRPHTWWRWSSWRRAPG